MLRLGNARALLVAALIAGAMGPAYPDDFGGVRILAYGNNTCGSFVKSDPQVKQMYLAWVGRALGPEFHSFVAGELLQQRPSRDVLHSCRRLSSRACHQGRRAA